MFIIFTLELVIELEINMVAVNHLQNGIKEWRNKGFEFFDINMLF